jgi:hypothetical protein
MYHQHGSMPLSNPNFCVRVLAEGRDSPRPFMDEGGARPARWGLTNLLKTANLSATLRGPDTTTLDKDADEDKAQKLPEEDPNADPLVLALRAFRKRMARARRHKALRFFERRFQREKEEERSNKAKQRLMNRWCVPGCRARARACGWGGRGKARKQEAQRWPGGIWCFSRLHEPNVITRCGCCHAGPSPARSRVRASHQCGGPWWVPRCVHLHSRIQAHDAYTGRDTPCTPFPTCSPCGG